MCTDIIEKIDKEIENARPLLVSDTIHFVSIRSVQEDPLPGAPFGEGPKKMLDEFMKIAEDDGFYVKDYGVGVVSASMKEGDADLGIWIHGDVVHEGEGWSFSPYDAVEYNGCIIGRGAGDNKGQLAAIYNLFKIFRKLGVELKYNAAIYLGSNEETGMKDIIGIPENPDAKGFLNVCEPPRLSLVPDGGFPVGYGGKGGLNIKLKSKSPLESLSFCAGDDEAPGLAVAKLYRKVQFFGDLSDCTLSEGKDELSASTPPRHGSDPDPNGNMITKLTSALIDKTDIPENDKKILSVLRDLSLDVYGEAAGISVESDIMGRLTSFPKKVAMKDGAPEIMLNIRYPAGITFEKIVEKIREFAEEREFEISEINRGVDAYIMDKECEMVRFLCDTANSVTGENSEPFTMSGGTYAHRLPNAYVFGTSANCPPEDFEKGRGGVHGIDEAVSIDRLIRMMKIYARALLGLNSFKEKK